MEPFLTSYGLPYAPFRDLLLSTKAMVAGSSALALYLKQEGVEVGFQPNDMDIFVGGSADPLEVIAFLEEHGYKQPLGGLPDCAFYAISHILDIVWLENAAHHNIQVIHVDTDSLLEYIAEQFDLSCCITWWDAERNVFETLYPNDTLRMDMFISNRDTFEEYCADTLRNTFRIHKYFSRGFRLHLLQTGPTALVQRDHRYELYTRVLPFNAAVAFDIWQHEDVSCRDFLVRSPFHILLKVAEQFYAFHRENLYSFASTHRTHVPFLGYVFRTPHNQSISYEALQSLLYADYSVYELHVGATVENRAVSLFHVYCYTVSDWFRQTPTRIILTDSYGAGVGAGAGAPHPWDDDDDNLPALVGADVNANANADQDMTDEDEDVAEWVAAIEAEYEYRED